MFADSTTPIWLSNTRTRKALLVAMEYKASPVPGVGFLNGIHNVLRNVQRHLVEHHSYGYNNIRTMMDIPNQGYMYPSATNILREIDALVQDARRGDRRFLYMAGHGTQFVNRRNTELDGLDEAILTAENGGFPQSNVDYLPTDNVRRGVILDNEFRQRLVNRMPEGSHLTVIIDACHSGTMLDLPYTWRCTGTSFQPLSQGPSYTFTSPSSHSSPLFVNGSFTSSPDATTVALPGQRLPFDTIANRSPRQRVARGTNMGASVVCLASSEDSQRTWSTPNQSMTSTLISILEGRHQSANSLTWQSVTEELNRQMFSSRQRLLGSKYDAGTIRKIQYPQLSSSREDMRSSICEF